MVRQQRTALILDDSPEDRELYKRYLSCDPEHSYTVLEAALGQQGLDLWQQHCPDVVLVDYRLPDLSGLEFLRKLQPLTQESCLPVIVVTGQGNEAIAVQAMKAGAQDYLVKGQITPAGLHLAVNGAIETVRLRTQLQQRVEREHVITQITQQIHQALSLNDILQTTVTEVRQFLHTDRVLVFRLHLDGNGTVVAESVGADWRSLLSATIHDPCLAEDYSRSQQTHACADAPGAVGNQVERYRQGQVTAIADIQHGSIDPALVAWLAQFQVRANLVVPIMHDDQFWGLLIAHHCTAPRSWQPLEIALLKELTTQMSIALRQAELYEQAQHELVERKRAEQSLRESEARYATLAQISPVGIFRTDVDGDCQYANACWCSLAGLTVEDAQGKGWVKAIHPNDRDRVVREWYRAATLNLPFRSEYRFQTPDGVVSWLVGQAVSETDAAGTVVGYVGTITDITDRKCMEQALQRSEERFRTSVENMLDCFSIYRAVRNEQGAIVDFQAEYINDAVCLVSQTTREQHLAHGLCEVLPAHRTNGLFAEYCQVVETGQSLVKDSLVYEDDFGQLRLAKALDIRAAKLGDGFVATWRDITDRKQVEVELQKSRTQLQQQLGEIEAIYQNAPIGLNVLDSELRFVRINQRLAAMNGYSVEAHLGRTIRELLPDLAGATETILNSILETGESRLNVEIQGETPAQPGIQRVWLEHFLPLKHDHCVIGISTVCEEITDRRQAEDALRQSEERYRTLFESMEDGFCVVELLFDEANTPIDYRFLEINPAFEHQTGLKQAVGQTARQLLPALEAHWFEIYGKVALTGEPVRFENGSDVMNRWFDVYAFRIGQPASRKVAILFKDISDRKAIETEREQLLQQEQVARETAERANRIKDEFLAILSHELRSPLNPILGWTKLLQTRRFDATKTAEALATIERNARLQTQLIDDLLDMAKVLHGKLSLTVTPVNLVLVIESAIDTVKTAAISKSIQLHPVLPTIGYASGDATRLQQIVWNLLSNAIKFTPIGGQVAVRLEQVESSGDGTMERWSVGGLKRYAQITVADTGKGINPAFLPHIFESFRQEDVSITRQYGGLGLGLAIVRQLVEAHGGTIAADSPGEGQGATFTVRLPLLHLESEPTQPDVCSEPEPDLTGIRVLTVDDDMDARDLLTAILTAYGAEVVAVASAADVFVALESFQPDLLISDIGMPEVDGYTFLQQLRSRAAENGGQLPAIALTAYAGEADQQRALRMGFARHLTKPIEPSQLACAVAALVKIL